MGAGQIGGIATMFEFDFHNAAGFTGKPATVLDAQHVVYYFSHAMLFCSGVLIEPHLVLTPAGCVYAEEYMFDVYGGSHKFLADHGTKRYVENICIHKGLMHCCQVYYFSHAMLFCSGVLIEPHLVLTPAGCVYAEEYMFDVYGGSHKFLADHGTKRYVENICIHKAYNHSSRWDHCMTDNVALLVLDSQFVMRNYEPKSEYIMNRVRYGVSYDTLMEQKAEPRCHYYGWGSRRNGFLLPLLIELRKVDVKILESSKCEDMFNTDGKYLCLSQPHCINEKFGALCPDDLGSVVECSGYIQGMMTSELIDRPCGVGFLNLAKYFKFLECAVDDSRDSIKGAPHEYISRETRETEQPMVQEISDRSTTKETQPEKETKPEPEVSQDAQRMGRYYEQDY